jgi:hypothetical protein
LAANNDIAAASVLLAALATAIIRVLADQLLI